ncbi:hypothetical protein K3495_g12542 [Podosphaera aphanis]|nr:hypothetical protein K3495_g12542 [Podosphaera aphanis]
MKSIQRYLTPVIGVIGSISRIIKVEDGMRWIFHRGRSGYHTRNTSDNCARCSRRLRKLNVDDKGQTHENLAADQFYTSHQKHYRLRGGAGHGPTAPTNQQTQPQQNGTPSSSQTSTWNIRSSGFEEESLFIQCMELSLRKFNLVNGLVVRKMVAIREVIHKNRLMFTSNEDGVEYPVNKRQFRSLKKIQKLENEILILFKKFFRILFDNVAPVLPVGAQIRLSEFVSRRWPMVQMYFGLLGYAEHQNFRMMNRVALVNDWMIGRTAPSLAALINTSFELIGKSLDVTKEVSIIIRNVVHVAVNGTPYHDNNNEQTHNDEQMHNNQPAYHYQQNGVNA